MVNHDGLELARRCVLGISIGMVLWHVLAARGEIDAEEFERRLGLLRSR